jgi:hypothetical protein
MCLSIQLDKNSLTMGNKKYHVILHTKTIVDLIIILCKNIIFCPKNGCSSPNLIFKILNIKKINIKKFFECILCQKLVASIVAFY